MVVNKVSHYRRRRASLSVSSIYMVVCFNDSLTYFDVTLYFKRKLHVLIQ